MNDAILLTLAEVAVALAGFSGVVTAFRLQGDLSWSSTELRILWFLILDSLCVMFFALIPIPLRLAGLSIEMIWLICSLLLGAWFIIGNWMAFDGERRDRAKKKLTVVPVISRLFRAVIITAPLMGIALCLSAFNIIPRGQALYVFGLIVLLAFAAIEFLFFIALAGRDKKNLNPPK